MSIAKVAVAPVMLLAGAAAAGPDLIVADTSSAAHWGSTGGIHAYSFSTTICNLGDAPVQFSANTSAHPIITQNLYRLSDGRFEQIGLGFVFHTFFALEQNFCATCSPVGGGSLGPGCSDVHSASINGSQSVLGPRSEIDPLTGDFPFPFTGAGQTGNIIFRRLQAHESDLSVANAQFFVEAIAVAPDDAAAGNGLNNATWRKVGVDAAFNINPIGAAMRSQPAIMAWSVHTGADVQFVDVPGDGRFYIGSLVTDNLDGAWTYEYAVENLNSARAAGAFTVPNSDSAITSIGFHDVDYHSGEPFDGTDWPGTATPEAVTWATDAYAVNPDANALRWGTLYNFRFVSDMPPQSGEGTLTLFAPGSPSSVQVSILIPGSICIADWNGDGVLNFFDIAQFLQAFSAADPRADLTDDGEFNFFDVSEFLGLFSQGCSR